MIRKTLLVVAVLAIGAIVAAPAQAGGSSGGTKKTVTLRVKNAIVNGDDVGVIPNLASAGLTPASTLDQYRAAGGQFIGKNAVGVFKVAPGNGKISAIDPAAPAVGVSTCDYVATAGRIGYLSVGGPTAAGAVIAPSTTAF